MYPGNCLTELVITERQMQMAAETDRLRRIKAIQWKHNKDRKGRIGSTTRHINALGASLAQKKKRLFCQC
jgi:hypothetical protein